MTLKIVVFAPTPRASVTTATAVNSGAFRIMRAANRTSDNTPRRTLGRESARTEGV